MKLSAEKIILAMGAVILLLLGIIGWLGLRPAPVPGIETVVTVDTQWLATPIDTQYLPAPEAQGEAMQPIPAAYQHSANCDSLKVQYNYLAQNYFSKRWYSRTLTQDSIRLTIIDTVQNNTLLGSTAIWNIKYPQVSIKEKTTITLPPVRQVYGGGGVGATFKGNGWFARAGLLMKNRRDNIIGVSIWGNNQLQYGGEVQAYWKIKIR